jgi:hypothetical protein
MLKVLAGHRDHLTAGLAMPRIGVDQAVDGVVVTPAAIAPLPRTIVIRSPTMPS